MEQHSSLRGASAFASGAFVLAVVMSACGGSNTAPPKPLTLQTETLPAAIATGCVYPGATAVTAKLPAAGGISGTLTVGAVAQASTVCSTVTVATGSDATLTASDTGKAATEATRRTTLSASTLPAPLLQISLTDDYQGNLQWQSVTLNVPPVSLPAGTYPTTITVDDNGEPFVQNYTITVDASGNATLNGTLNGNVLVTLQSGVTGVLSIYPLNTTLPSPTPTFAASPTPSPSPSASPSPSPSPTPTPIPSAPPLPTPTPSSNVTLSLSPFPCIDAPTAQNIEFTATTTGVAPPAGSIYEYGWISLFPNTTIPVTVPPPTTTYPYFNLTLIVGPTGTATFAVPDFGPNGGAGAYIAAFLFTEDIATSVVQPVLDSTGKMIEAKTWIAAGIITCEGSGF